MLYFEDCFASEKSKRNIKSMQMISNETLWCPSQGRQKWGGKGGGCPPSFLRFSPIILKFGPNNVKSQIIPNVLPPQFLRCPLSFREVVTPLTYIVKLEGRIKRSLRELCI